MNRGTIWQRVLALWLLPCALAAAADGPVRLRFALPFPPGTKDYKAIHNAASKVTSLTLGRVEFEWVEADMKRDAAEDLLAGRIDVTLLPTAGLADRIPAAALLALPMLFRDLDEAALVDGMIAERAERSLADLGLTTLARTGIGFTYLMAVKPVTTPAQLKSARLWLPEGEAYSKALSGAGAEVIQTPMDKVQDALRLAKTGDATVPDTLIGWPSLVVARRWHTEITDVLDLPFFFVDTRALARQGSLDGIAAADREVLRAELEHAFAEVRGFQATYHEQYERALKRYGATFHEPTAAEQAEWTRFGREWAERVAKERGIEPGLLQEVQRRLDEARRNR